MGPPSASGCGVLAVTHGSNVPAHHLGQWQWFKLSWFMFSRSEEAEDLHTKSIFEWALFWSKSQTGTTQELFKDQMMLYHYSTKTGSWCYTNDTTADNPLNSTAVGVKNGHHHNGSTVP